MSKLQVALSSEVNPGLRTRYFPALAALLSPRPSLGFPWCHSTPRLSLVGSALRHAAGIAVTAEHVLLLSAQRSKRSKISICEVSNLTEITQNDSKGADQQTRTITPVLLPRETGLKKSACHQARTNGLQKKISHR